MSKKYKFKIDGMTKSELLNAFSFVTKHNEIDDIKGFYISDEGTIVFCDGLSDPVIPYPFDATLEMVVEHAINHLQQMLAEEILNSAGHGRGECEMGWEIYSPNTNSSNAVNPKCEHAFIIVKPKWVEI